MRRHLATVFAVFCLSAAAFAAAHAQQATSAPAQMSSQDVVPLIQVSGLQALIEKKKPFVLVDVRQPEEFAQGHIDGAILMPLGTVSERYSELPKNKKIVVYCHSGKRSAKAVSILRAHGYTKAVSLNGGYMAWSNAQPPKLKL